MPLSKKVLEDSIRLDRIRGIKITLYLIQVIMLAALAFVLIFLIGGATITPRLYLPIDSFVAVMVLLLLVICVESFFFRIMEIRFARSSSSRHLMAKNSRERAIVIVLISAIFTIILMVPAILNYVEDSTEKTAVISVGEEYSLWSRDPLAFQVVREIHTTSTDTMALYMVKDYDYQNANGSLSYLESYRINRDEDIVDGELTIHVPDGENTLYHIIAVEVLNPSASATLVIRKDTSEMFTSVVSVLALAFVVTNIAWIAYLIPIERKYSQGSIYK